MKMTTRHEIIYFHESDSFFMRVYLHRYEIWVAHCCELNMNMNKSFSPFNLKQNFVTSFSPSC
jgi:hypothetical protein